MASKRNYGSGSIYQRKSDGRWFASLFVGYLPNGTQRRVTVSAKTEAEVKRKVRDLARKVETEKGFDLDRRTTVRSYAYDWLPRQERRVRPATYRTDKSSLEKWILPTIGHRRLVDLKPGDIRAVTDAIRAAGLSSSTARRCEAVLQSMLKAAALDGAAVSPRLFMVQKSAMATHDRQALTAEEAMRVLAEAGKLPHGSRWLVALMLGMRRNECLGLTWDAIDLDRGLLRVEWQLQHLPYKVPRDRSSGFRVPDGYEIRQLVGAAHLTRPKTKKGYRVIPLAPAIVKALRDWQAVAPPNPYGLVWTGPKGLPRNIKEDADEWVALQRAAFVQHPSGRPYLIHEARNTTATLLMELGVPESVRLAIMGHSSIAVTRGYEFASVDEQRAAMEATAARLELG